jgi:hypothetical protein
MAFDARNSQTKASVVVEQSHPKPRLFSILGEDRGCEDENRQAEQARLVFHHPDSGDGG